MSEATTRLNAALEGRYRIERELGASEAATTLGTLRRLAAGIEIWASRTI
jgi:hypothetical protein